MRDIIQWLRKIEHLASEVYSLAALAHSSDRQFAEFLAHMAEEEAWHYHVMGSAAHFLEEQTDLDSAIAVDQETGERILNYFVNMRYSVENKSISSLGLLEKIVEAELSEWNDIFLYVVTSLKQKTSEFKYPAARIQSHIKGIVQYAEGVENNTDVLKKLSGLPTVWIEKILIVEDTKMIATLLKALLNRDGDVDIASNGEEGLQLIEKNYYKLIISDIDMPIMDGIALYQEATSRFPKLNTRFLFITGDLSLERQNFFNSHKIRCLTKPMEIKKLRELSLDILLSN